jgi:hypothetical protein
MPEACAAAALLNAWLTAFDEADEAAKRAVAERLRPLLVTEPERLLSARQKAAQLGLLNHETLGKMARAGRVPGARKVGREWRFPAGAMEIKPPRGEAQRMPDTAPARRAQSRPGSTAAAIRGAQ